MKLNQKRIVFLVAAAVVIIGIAAIAFFALGSHSERQRDREIVSAIYVAQEPDRLNYVEGEEFDPTGTVINATTKDGSTLSNVPYEVICASPLVFSRYSVTFKCLEKSVSIQLNITKKGNTAGYSLDSTPVLDISPLSKNVFFFLGSSVTKGERSEGESMVDFLAKRNGCTCIKDAVSGTTLMDNGENSYVQRLDAYLASSERAEYLDSFICQLSTNDIKFPDLLGSVSDATVRDAADFDTATTFGAVEYIIAKARETWDCPIVFYTNSNFHNENYEKMLALLDQIKEKWDIDVIDLYRDSDFNDISEEQLDLYMSDNTHPTRAGYRDWWTPQFEVLLAKLCGGVGYEQWVD